MIVIDTSAVVAVMTSEPDHERIVERLLSANEVQMSTGSYVEAGMVLALKTQNPDFALAALQSFLARMDIHLVALDVEQARVALEARVRFGKGFSHPAQLNYGDSFAYALAKVRSAPLLYVGEDFARTDIEAALV